MALRKNRTEILDKIITKAELGSDYYWVYWDCDDDDYYYWDCDNCGKHYCNGYECVCYEYLPEEFQPKSVEYISKRYRITFHSISPGRMVDMNSFYSKEILRQKRINHILGVEKMIGYSKTTIGDILESRK